MIFELYPVNYVRKLQTEKLRLYFFYLYKREAGRDVSSLSTAFDRHPLRYFEMYRGKSGKSVPRQRASAGCSPFRIASLPYTHGAIDHDASVAQRSVCESYYTRFLVCRAGSRGDGEGGEVLGGENGLYRAASARARRSRRFPPSGAD